MLKHNSLRTVFVVLALFSTASAAAAQSVLENLPPEVAGTEAESDGKTAAPAAPAPASAETFSVSDVTADVTAETAARARDQALTQATRTAFQQLCQRVGLSDVSASLTDDDLAMMVRSFDIQNEKISAKRYIGTYTIHFKPAAIQKLGHIEVAQAQPQAARIQGPLSMVAVAVPTPSLAALTQLKRQLGLVPQIQRIDMLDLGRGVSHIALSYGGSLDELRISVTNQGLVLQQATTGEWQLFPASLVRP